MTTLLACPFCGEQPFDDRPQGYMTIVCVSILCRVRPKVMLPPATTAEALAAAWNRRAPPVAIAHEAVDLRDDVVDMAARRILPRFMRDTGECREALRRFVRYLLTITPTASDRPVVRAEQVAAVALNASRYVWLRKTGGRYTAKLGREVDLMADWNTDVMAPDSELDDAIDAAMLLEADRAAPPSGDDRG